MTTTRQAYEEIRDCLMTFQSHAMRLTDLIEQVPSLVKQISDDDEAWRAEFVGYWWTLEQVHEEAIEVGESRRLPEARRQVVDDSVTRMLELVNRKVQINLDE